MTTLTLIFFLFLSPFLLLPQTPATLYSQCPDTCATCISKVICTSCLPNFFLISKQCSTCDLTNSLFICSTDFFNWNIAVPTIFTGKLQVIFNRNFDMSDASQQMNNTNVVIFPNVSNGSYSLKSVDQIAQNALELTFDLKFSFRNKFFNVSFLDPFFYFDSENNFLVNSSEIVMISEFINYSYLNTNALSGFIYFLEAFMLVLFIFMFFTEYFHLFWLFLDAMQTLNVFFLINTSFPPILSTFLQTLGMLNFTFMSTWCYTVLNQLSNSNSQLDIPLNFTNSNKSSSFFYNFGDLMVFLLLMLIILFFLIGFMKRHAKNSLTQTPSKTNKFSKGTAESIHSNLLLIVGKNMEWKVILKYLEVISYNMLIGTLLALRYCDLSQSFGVLDFVFAVIFSVVMIIVVRAMFKIINNTYVFIGNKEHYRKYGILFENIDIKRFVARNFSLIISIQKLCLVLAVIILFEFGYAQIIVMMASQFGFFMIYLLSLPFYEIQQNVLFLTVQGILIFELFIILGIKAENENTKNQDIIDDNSVQIQENLGIVAFVFGMLVFLVFVGGIFALILKKRQEKKKFLVEMNNASANNNSKRTLADKYNMA